MSADHFAVIPVRSPAPVAAIGLRQLSALLAFLRDRGEPTADPATGSHRIDIEVNVRRWSLASLTALFNHDPAVIAVVEEAQFRRSNVRIWRMGRGNAVMIGIASSFEQFAGDGSLRAAAISTIVPACDVAIC